MYYKILKTWKKFWQTDDKLAFSLYSFMPVEWYAENYNKFRHFDKVYFGWLGDNWDSNFNLLPEYFKPLAKFNKKHYIVFRFQDVSFFQNFNGFVAQFELLADMLSNELRHITGVCFDVEYIAPHYNNISLPWYNFGRLISKTLTNARPDIDIRVLPIGYQHNYGPGCEYFCRGINPDKYIDELAYQITDFASIHHNKFDLQQHGFYNVETGFFPLGNNNNYCDKTANYTIENFENQINNARLSNYHEAMIYSHEAWYQIDDPSKYKLPWGNVEAYKASTVDNIQEYYNLIERYSK